MYVVHLLMYGMQDILGAQGYSREDIKVRYLLTVDTLSITMV